MLNLNCVYCGSGDTTVRYAGKRHKVDPSFGPFDLFECKVCGSLGTANLPSAQRLAEFYKAYEEHRPEWYVNAAASSALRAQYQFYAEFIAKHLANPAGHRWLDVGAGHGEVANLLTGLLPGAEGHAVDIGPAPATLDPRVSYTSLDINDGGWRGSLRWQYDLVYSVAVWEHVVSPLSFARESLSLLAKGGVLVMICPDYGSIASRAFGQAWPYFEPGEHLSVPTQKGAKACVQRAIEDLDVAKDTYNVTCSPLWVGYSIRYVLEVLRLQPLAKIVPPDFAAPLPTGIIATVVSRR